MANAHIKLDKTKDISRNNIRAIQLIREGFQLLSQNRDAMIQMRGSTGEVANNGSQDAHYATLALEGGYQAGTFASDHAAARASFEEFDSLFAQLNGAPLAALSQVCAKHNA